MSSSSSSAKSSSHGSVPMKFSFILHSVLTSTSSAVSIFVFCTHISKLNPHGAVFLRSSMIGGLYLFTPTHTLPGQYKRSMSCNLATALCGPRVSGIISNTEFTYSRASLHPGISVSVSQSLSMTL